MICRTICINICRTICRNMICRTMIRMNMICSAKTFCVSTLVLLFASLALGQGGVATGDLHITVKDPKGSLVTNAKVTVNDVAKGLARGATGDGQGGYSARLLPPGAYTVTIEAPGFGKVEATDVSITVGARSGQRKRSGRG
jgi:Carboxypeptidase regulatory-like domain